MTTRLPKDNTTAEKLIADIRAELARSPRLKGGRLPKLSPAQFLYVRAVVRRRERLERQIAMLPTIEQMADQLGVSHATVSRATRGLLTSYQHLVIQEGRRR